MNSGPNKPIKADELTEKELEGIVGGITVERRVKPERTTGQIAEQGKMLEVVDM